MSGDPRAWLRWSREGTTFLTLATVVGVGISAVATVHPLGFTGRPLALLALLVVNLAFLAGRLVPLGVLPERALLPYFIVGTLAAAAIMAVTPIGTVITFAFLFSGHAGYRLPPDRSIPIAGLSSVLATVALICPVPVDTTDKFAPWYVGALTGVSVLLGIASRSRTDALRSATEAAEQAQLVARSEARADALAERGRIARDVHDVLAHSLAGVNMQLEVADALLDAGDIDQAQAATRRAQSLVREGLVEVQRTVRSLREDALPLVETLRALVDSPDADLEVVGPAREVDVRIGQALVRSAQEALTNARKYAPGARTRVTLHFAVGRIELEIVNGPATAAERPLAPVGSGMGLVGMRERIALVDGIVTAGPVLDGSDRGGWRVFVTVPS